MEIRYFLIAIIMVFLMAPAMAGTLYISDGPTFTATISGTNQFSPGKDVQLPVKIENRGLNYLKFVQTGYIERDDLPNTAKFVTASLAPGDSPMIIKSDSQVMGDLPGGKSVQVTYNIKIPKQAAAGQYLLPLAITYQYLAGAEQSAGDLIEYNYKTKTVVVTLPVTIEPNVFLDVSPVINGGLNVGTEGYLDLNITNSGGEDAHDAIIKIQRNGNSPVTPTDSSVYIGDFPAGNSTVCRFKVSVSRDAEAQEYPVDVIALYKNHEGDTVTSAPVTVGIPVHGRIGFDVVAADSKMSVGKKKVIEVTYRNSGDGIAYNAQARISVVDPFTSNDDSAYLGDIAPGKTAVARYEVGVSSDAVAKEYALDSEVRYRDSLDNSQISDTVKVPVTVVQPTAAEGIMGNLVFILVGIIVVVAAEDLNKVLADRSCTVKGPVYFMYRDLARSEEDREWLHDARLRYDVTVIPPKALCGECVKTKGHYHPENVQGVGYPEIYEIIEGSAEYLLQDKPLSDAVVVSAGTGDIVLIPPGYGHVTINPGDSVLVMANIVSTAFSSIYEDYEDLQGAVYYLMETGGYVKNPRYPAHPQLRHIRKCDVTGFPDIKGRSLYDIIRAGNSLSFLNYPERFNFDTVLKG